MRSNIAPHEPKLRPPTRLDIVKAKLMRDVLLMRKSPTHALKEYHREKRKEEHLAEVKTELICDVIRRRRKPAEAIRIYRQEKRKTMKPSSA